jgi:hypothetical protein
LGFFSDASALQTGLAAALSGRFGEQHNGLDHLVLMLNRVSEFKPELGKIFR